MRKSLNLTQQEFADRIGSKRNTIAKYETNANTPSTAVISLICREFNVNETWLRTGEGEMFKDEVPLFNEENTFSKRFKQLRKALDLTQQDLADRIGVKRGGIANYEISRNIPTNSVISLVCREFNVNETWLRTGEGEMFKREISLCDEYDTLSKRLKRLRKSLDLTQQEFATKLGVQRNTIAMYEIGRTIPSNTVILFICSEFNINESWLRTGEGNMFKSEISLCDECDTFSIRLKRLRKLLDLTQQEFADKLAVKRNTVGQWEIGRNPLTNSSILSICREFNVNEAWLRTGEGEIFNETSSEQFQSENSFEDNLISVLTQISNQLERIADTLTKDEEQKKKDQL